MDSKEIAALHATFHATPDEAVLETLIKAYTPLCAMIARRFQGRGVDMEDLFQTALVALTAALKRYDLTKGFSFSTFATPTIIGTIRNYIRDKGSAVRFSRDKMSMLGKMVQVRESLSLSLGHEPSASDVAQAMNILPTELLELMQLKEATTSVSMDAPLCDETAQDLSQKLGRIDSGYQNVEDKDELARLFSHITPFEQQVLIYRFAHSMGQRDVANALGISQMQVSRIERRVLERLRNIAKDGNR